MAQNEKSLSELVADDLAGTVGKKALSGAWDAIVGANTTMGSDAASLAAAEAASTSNSGLFSAASLAALPFAALAGPIAGKIAGKFLEPDDPILRFQGSERDMFAAAQPGQRDGNPILQQDKVGTYGNGLQSAAGFDYVLGGESFDGSDKVRSQVRNYLDSAFTQMQAQTDVDLNELIKYGISDIDVSSTNPAEWASKLVSNVADAVKTGGAITNDPSFMATRTVEPGKYISDREQYLPYQEVEQAERAALTGREAFDSNYDAPKSGKDIQDRQFDKKSNRPVYSDLPSTKGDPNFSFDVDKFNAGFDWGTQTNNDKVLNMTDQNSQLVRQQFNTLFGRDPEQAGLDYWANALNSGQVSKQQFNNALLEGAQRPDVESYVQQQFRQNLGRDPKFAGSKYWTDALMDENNPVNFGNFQQSLLNGRTGQDTIYSGFRSLNTPNRTALQELAQSSVVNPASSRAANYLSNVTGQQSPDYNVLQQASQLFNSGNDPKVGDPRITRLLQAAQQGVL